MNGTTNTQVVTALQDLQEEVGEMRTDMNRLPRAAPTGTRHFFPASE